MALVANAITGAAGRWNDSGGSRRQTLDYMHLAVLSVRSCTLFLSGGNDVFCQRPVYAANVLVPIF